MMNRERMEVSNEELVPRTATARVGDLGGPGDVIPPITCDLDLAGCSTTRTTISGHSA